MKQIAKYQNLPDYQKLVLPDGKRLIITYNNQESTFKFSNGSFIQFAYLDNIADRYRYMSAEIHLLLIDELTHFLRDDYEYLKTRVRSAEDRRLRIMAATNPGNIGHGWVRDYFIESKDPNIHYVPEEVYTDEANGNTRVFIPAKVTDHPNKRFQESYLKVLNAIPDIHLRKALRDGDWHTFEGQVYGEWDHDRHTVDKLPEGWETWPKYIGFDWGYNDWACASWICVQPENDLGIKHLYVYRELYDRQKPPTWWAKEIRKYIDTEPIEYMILPHDCFSHLGGHQTIARTFSDYEIPHVRADSQSHGAKMHRIALLHQLLADSPDGEPIVKFVKTCANNIRTIPDLPYSDTRPEEIADKSEDHAFDATTYGLMVVTDGQTWIVGGEDSMREAKKSFYVNEQGEAEGLEYDMKKALQKNNQIEKDWMYL